jgi:2-polyprenyl-3-methyl-5-hydroxy-6-metoxy-1,4-benzoquinol methylase
MQMLYHVPDVPAAVGELRRIVRPSGVVLGSTNSGGMLAEVYDLFDAAVSDFLGRPVRARSALSFTTETGTAVLEAEFSGVILHRHEVPPGIPLSASARRLPQ